MATIPSIIAWNRLEPRPRSKDFTRALRAEIRDPLWMLTRQWQMGEFKAEDRVSPAYLEIEVETDLPVTLRSSGGSFSRDLDLTVPDLDLTVPLETVVEQSYIPQDVGLQLQMGRHWGKILKYAGLGMFLSDFVMADPVLAAQEGPYEAIKTEEVAFRRSVAGKALNGLALYEKLQISNNYALTVISNSEESGADLASGTTADALAFQEKVLGAVASYLEWFRRLYSQPSEPAESTWNANRLEHQFELVTSGGKVLTSEGFHSGKLEWYSFNRKVQQSEVTLPVTYESLIPVEVQFPGMPSARWWEMEDYQINFGDLEAVPSDVNRLLYLDFLYSYKNDWFVVPLTVRNGSLCQVKSLVVTDVFGFKHRIKGANEGIFGNWNLFGLHKENTPLTDTERLLFVPPVVTKTLEGAPIEKVSFLRDEMSNMVWGVEQVVPNGLGGGMNGYDAASRFREIVRGSRVETTTGTGDALTFTLAASVPVNWIPFIPVRAESFNSIRLQRATMPVSDTATAMVLAEPATTVLAEPSPYYLHEEEITRAGTIVERTFQRARWYNGKTVVWCGYKKQLGRGEGSSGLIFDQLKTREV